MIISQNLNWLIERRSWITYRNYTPPGSSKPDRIPLDPSTGRAWDCNDDAIWQSLGNCIYLIRHHPNIHNGPGFVFSTETRPVVGIDIDGYKLKTNPPNDNTNPPNSAITQSHAHTREMSASTRETAISVAVRNIVAGLQTYIEFSPSGKGFHAFGFLIDQNTAARLGSSRQGLLDCIEIFYTTRYFTMTFTPWRDLPLVDISHVINFILDEHERLVGPLPPTNQIVDDGVIAPFTLPGPPDNRELQIVLAEVIERLRAMRPWDHEDQTRHLYIPLGAEHDADMLAKREIARQQLFARMKNDHSDVDAAVARNVAYFTNRVDVFEAVMMRTGLYRDPGTYGKTKRYLGHTFKKAHQYLQQRRSGPSSQVHGGLLPDGVFFPTNLSPRQKREMMRTALAEAERRLAEWKRTPS